MKRDVLLLSICALLAPISVEAAIQIEMNNRALSIRGLTPGARVALFSIAREPDYFMDRVVIRQEILADEDHDGTILHAPTTGVAARSVWTVVNLATGESAVASPGGPPLLMQPRAGRGRGVEVIANTLDLERNGLLILLVRPGVGAWATRAWSGGPADLERSGNGRMRLDLSALSALVPAFGKAPPALRPGDVTVVLDAGTLEVWLSTFGQGDDR